MKVKISNSLKVLIQNFGYLTILNIITLVAPLITLPYLLKVLGTEVYGAVVYAQAFGYYMELIVRFGFNITGVKYVSENRDNILELSKGVSSILIIKFSLFLVILLVVWGINFFTTILDEYPYLLFLSMWITFYQVIEFSWYFQGKEKMQFITIADFTLRIVFILLIFSFVKSEADYLLVPIFYGVGALLSGLLMFYIVFVKEKVRLLLPNKKQILKMVSYSYPIFLSQISQLYSKLNKVVVGMFLGYNDVAIYDLVEKVINVFKMPINIIGATVFPRISYSKSVLFIKKSFMFSLAVYIVLCLILFFFSDYLLLIITKDANIVNKVSYLVRFFEPVLIIVTINVFLGRNTLFVFGYKKIYVKSIMFASLSYLITVGLLYFFDYFSLLSIIFSIMLAEITAMTISIYNVYKYRLLHDNK